MITIDGSANTITGLAAGGLPDATVTTADIVDANITASKLSGAQTGAAPIYGCRAWCVFNGTTAGTNAPTAGGNVTSITRNGTGDYTINFTTALPDANYSVVIAAGYQGQTLGIAVTSTSTAPTSSAYRFRTSDASSVLQDSTRISVAIFR
jgi:hypothetical protein